MKHFPTFCALTVLALSACDTTTTPGDATAKMQNTRAAARYFENGANFTIAPIDVKAALEKNQKITIVDVRATIDYKAGHIPGALDIPYDQWDHFEGSQTHFPALRKDGFNYVYGYDAADSSGQKAASKFAAAGYPVKEMRGGFQAWKDHNYPTEQ